MEELRAAGRLIAVLFALMYSYQLVYTAISLMFRRVRGKNRSVSPKINRYAILICARNEEAVIGDLIRSIKAQTYPQELIRTYVMADNCTDATAAIAEEALGATVFERSDILHVGKGYALDALLKLIHEEETGGFDGYFIFDADNVLAPDYIEQMDMTFSEGCDIVTGYRNTKNYGYNWISAAYGLWFLRESMFLNLPRSIIGSSCTVSGTGFMFSRRIAEELGGWPYHTLTEDLEFSADQITRGRRIAFCRDAELFDEQPVDLAQSWDQRMRWSKGYLQVIGRYGVRLLEGIAEMSFSCLDFALSIAPAFLLTLLSMVIDVSSLVGTVLTGGSMSSVMISICGSLVSSYCLLFFIGALTLASEWKRIHAEPRKKVGYLFLFPVFMFTYIPIAAASLFVKVRWKPIRHTFSADTLGETGAGGAA